MKIVILIQARMGSKRLPGKSLLKLAGKPLVQWVFDGVLQSKLANEIVFCIPNTKENKDLELYLRNTEENKKENKKTNKKAKIFVGSESDVLLRFIEAGKKYNADIVVRVCADNPLVSGKEIDRLIRFYLERKPDYAFNHIPKMNNAYPDGLGAEIVALELLEKIYPDCSQEEREHVTKYFWKHEDCFDIKTFPAPKEIAFPEVKLDIDSKEDFERMESFCGLCQKNGIQRFDTRSIVDLYRQFVHR